MGRLLPLLLVVLGAFAYAGTFGNAFIFDDEPAVQHVVGLGFSEFLGQLAITQRPVADLSMWLNGLVGGDDPLMYHVFNLVVHLTGGLLLFGILRQILCLDRFKERFGQYAHWYAFAVSGLWVLHPLQTQAVTYVVQRHESMMGMFYLAVVYALVRLARAERKGEVIGWGVMGVIAAFLGWGRSKSW